MKIVIIHNERNGSGMRMINELLGVLIKTKIIEKRSEYIFYKIVNFNEKISKYLIQYINTKATFHSSLNEIVSDTDVLYGMHPVQACYVGIEYVMNLKESNSACVHTNKTIESFLYCRYGLLYLRYMDRKQNLFFENIETKEEFYMDPRDISLSEDIINEFDAIQAFHIGFLAGLKMCKPVPMLSKRESIKRMFTIIK